MKSIKLALIYGFLIWLIPFIVSFPIYSLRETNRALFESIMSVVLVLVVAVFGKMYFKKLDTSFLREGIVLGILWFLISIVIDLFMFMWGPMKMSFADYMADIGLTYLIIPIIIISFGYLLEKKIKV